jgi:hypothetical protein
MISHVFKVCGEGDRTIDCDLDLVTKIQITLDNSGAAPEGIFNNVWGTLNRWAILVVDGWAYHLNKDNGFTVEFDPPMRKLKTPTIHVMAWWDGGGGTFSVYDQTLAPTTGTIRLTAHHHGMR